MNVEKHINEWKKLQRQPININDPKFRAQFTTNWEIVFGMGVTLASTIFVYAIIVINNIFVLTTIPGVVAALFNFKFWSDNMKDEFSPFLYLLKTAGLVYVMYRYLVEFELNLWLFFFGVCFMQALIILAVLLDKFVFYDT